MNLCSVCKVESKLYYDFGFISLYRCVVCNLIYSNKPSLINARRDWGKELEDINNYYMTQFEYKDNKTISLLRKLKIKPPGKFVDIGCAMGTLLKRMKCFGWRVSGVEPAKSLCNLAREKCGIVLINKTFSSKIFKKNTLDLVSILDVIEHVDDPNKMLFEIYQILKLGGQVIIKTPNFSSLTAILCIYIYKLTFGIVKTPVIMLTQADQVSYHKYYFTGSVFQKLLLSNKYKIVYSGKEQTIIKEIMQRREVIDMPGLIFYSMIISFNFIKLIERIFNMQDTLVFVAKKV